MGSDALADALGRLPPGDGATGILCASDLMAFGVIRAARGSGRGVPRDVSVIGFDDAGPNAYVDPPLTSVQQPFEAMAAAVVRLLTDRATSARGASTAELRFRPELVVRGSTGAGPDRANGAVQTPATAPSHRGSLPPA